MAASDSPAGSSAAAVASTPSTSRAKATEPGTRWVGQRGGRDAVRFARALATTAGAAVYDHNDGIRAAAER
jgi:hypothetical protein